MIGLPSSKSAQGAGVPLQTNINGETYLDKVSKSPKAEALTRWGYPA